ncbi:hypothetical protein [Bradyrhizobium sp. ORS 86]
MAAIVVLGRAYHPCMCTRAPAAVRQRASDLLDPRNPNLFIIGEFIEGASPEARRVMTRLSAGDVFLTVTIMSVAFLIEVTFFALIGIF